jgi:hypothetical protein
MSLSSAGVVDDAGGDRRREVLLGDEVLPADLQPVHAKLVGELVERDLDHLRRLGTSGAADRVRRALVREHPGDVGPDVGDLVTAAHHEGAQRRNQRRQDHVVGAEVGQDLDVERGDRAVALGPHLDVGDLVTPLVGDRHVLRARLRPLDRKAELARRPAGEQLLAVDLQLLAEAAADVGRDHADVILAEAEQQRHEQPDEVGNLRRGVQRQRPGTVVGDDAAALDRRAGDAVVDDPALDDHVGLRKALLDIPAGQRPLVDLVRAQ